MDLRGYYRKIREIEESIGEPYVVLSSFVTGDGGKAGVMTEVSRADAARMVVENRARLATPEESAEYFERVKTAQEALEADSAKKRLQLTVITEADLREIREASKKK